MKVTVYSNGYLCEHGHRPRGRGVWIFSPRYNVMGNDREVIWITGNKTFTEAKAEAVKHFKARGVDTVYVLP